MVHLESASNLAARDVWGSSDPYAVFTLGRSTHRSAAVMRDLNPKWDETFVLYVRDAERERLTLRVLDKVCRSSRPSVCLPTCLWPSIPCCRTMSVLSAVPCCCTSHAVCLSVCLSGMAFLPATPLCSRSSCSSLCLAQDFATSDDLIGEATVALRELCDGEAHAVDVELSGAERNSRVQMAVQFLPFTGT
jgi:C2 domain